MKVELDFDTFFRREYRRLVALGTAMSGDGEVARELAQEAMLRAHDRWEQVVDLDDSAAWIRRVMVNLLIDHHRRRQRERSVISVLGRRPAVTSDVAADHAAATNWASLIAALSVRQRAVVVLHYGEDRSVDEIAAILGVSTGTVKSTLAKARRRIEQLVQGGPHD